MNGRSHLGAIAPGEKLADSGGLPRGLFGGRRSGLAKRGLTRLIRAQTVGTHFLRIRIVMDKNPLTRRAFLKTTAAASAAVAVAPGLAIGAQSRFDAKGLPTRLLGDTGERLPILSIGTGSRFMAVEDEERAAEILTYALDHGLYHWDTAASYGRPEISSEERLGKLLSERRSEVFLSTKVEERKGDDAKRTIERSLKRLRTDFIDLYQVHAISSVEDVAEATAPDGVLPVLLDYREQGIIRHVGFTGHLSAEAMKAAAAVEGFETMLCALNHYQEQGPQAFEEGAVPTARSHGLGVLVMKTVRPRETVEGLHPRDLIRYALSLPDVTAAVVGTDSLEVVQANVDLLRTFTPMSEDEKAQIRLSLAPFYRGRKLPWMDPSYRDQFLA